MRIHKKLSIIELGAILGNIGLLATVGLIVLI